MKKAIILLSFSLFLLSCSVQETENVYINQEADIVSYIDKNFADYDTTVVNGAIRVSIPYGDDVENPPVLGETLEKGDSLLFYYLGAVFNKSITSIFHTNIQSVAEDNNLNLTDGDFRIKRIKYGDTRLLKGLENGLKGVKEGEHILIFFSGKQGYGDKPMYNIPKSSALAFEIFVQEVKKN